MENVKMFLFARWMSTHYSSTILNTEDGEWWKEQLEHFNNTVYPNYVKNGSAQKTLIYINDLKEKRII